MALEDIGRGAKSLVVPAAASLAGAGAGLILTRKSVRSAMPDLGGIGGLADDLRSKVQSVAGKAQQSSSSSGSGRNGSSQSRTIDSGELDQRLREREERRKARRSRS